MMPDEPHVQVFFVGYADSVPVRNSDNSVFSNNYELTVRRAKVVADLFKTYLSNVKVVVIGKGDFEAVKGSSVDLDYSSERRVDIYISKDESIVEKLFGYLGDR